MSKLVGSHPVFRNFIGSNEAIKWAMRDIETIREAMTFCSDQRSVIQAGGCLGVFPKFLSENFKTVYTFEADQHLFKMMCSNLMEEKNIIKFNAAVGYDRGCVSTSYHRRDGKPNIHEGITHIDPLKVGNIPTLRIDDLFITNCDLLILDLEGWEPHALLGAKDTIFHNKPVIMIEINKNVGYYGEYSPDDVRSMLNHSDYELKKCIHSDEIWVPK